jgi:hypothetical protein
MAETDTDRILALARRALDDIDERPVSATARSTARVALLLGETALAVRLGLELKPTRGDPAANAEDTRRLMADPSTWGSPDSPVEDAISAYSGNRRIVIGDEAGKIDAHSLVELEAWLRRIATDAYDSEHWLEQELRSVAILEGVRHTCFAALCAWERRLTYANTNEHIFARFRSRVDEVLAAGAPHVLDQFSSVYRRLHDAASDPNANVGEEVAQAVTSCRRILKAVADHLLPGEHARTSDDGHALDDSAYRNRLFEYLKSNAGSDTSKDAIEAALGGVYKRFAATDKLASKGVHASVGLTEAESCALSTYIIAGELLVFDAGRCATDPSPERDDPNVVDRS